MSMWPSGRSGRRIGRLPVRSAAVIVLAVVLVAESRPARAAEPPPPGAAPAPLTFGWARTWGGGSAESRAQANRIAMDGRGNLYVAGEFKGTVDLDPDPARSDVRTSAEGSIDATLSKFDANGRLLWARTWGGKGRDVAYGVAADGAGNVYVVGAYRQTVDFDPDPARAETRTSNHPSENNVYLSKFAPDGTFQWVRTWGPCPMPGRISMGAEAYSVIVHGNHLYVVGDFSGNKTDFNPWGGHDWHQNHIPPAGPVFFDAFLCKLDTDGRFVWARTWGGEGYDDGPGVAADAAGNLYVAGMYASQKINFDPAGGAAGLGHPARDSGFQVDVFLSKFDSDGNFKWVRTWGGKGTEDAMGSVAVDGENGVYVAGRFASLNCDFNPGGTACLHSTRGRQDVFVSKFDSTGRFQWARTWGGKGDDQATVAVDARGNVYVSGWFADTVNFNPAGGTDNRASNGQHDAFLSRFGPGGAYLGANTWGGKGEDGALGGAVSDAEGNVYVAGKFAGTVDFNPGGTDGSRTAGGEGGAFVMKLLSGPGSAASPPADRR